MTIKIQAYQKHGVKTKEIIDEYEFCCWTALMEWLESYPGLHSCPQCKEKYSKDNKRVYSDSTLQKCYEMGFDSINGANEENSNYNLFTSPDRTTAWERGRKDAKESKEVKR